MAALPSPRGELSAALLDALGQPVQTFSPRPEPVTDDPLADDDLQLALYLCYELHYRGLPGVDDAWEWEPSLLAFRGSLEREFEAALRETVPQRARSVPAAEVDLALREISERACPPLSR